jgi:hypothetical protein
VVFAHSACDEQKPASVEQFIEKANADRDAGDYPSARVELRNALQRDPKNVDGRV